MPTVTVTLRTAQSEFPDIQINSPDDAPYLRTSPNLVFVALVNYRLIPIFLVSNGPYQVYSDHNETEAFFIRSLVQQRLNLGILSKYPDQNGDVYVVFYVDETSKGIKCMCLDFLILSQFKEYEEQVKAEENIFFANKSRLVAYKSDTSVFDRVLENKTTRKSLVAPISTSGLSTTPLSLSTPSQISQAINKIILLGLRLRGLIVSELTSAKDKIAIQEIHQMTKKAGLFAIRKFKYDFNAGQRGHDLLLATLQDIVESLLQTFVDIPKSE